MSLCDSWEAVFGAAPQVSIPKPFTLTDPPCSCHTPHTSQQLDTKPLSKYVAKTAHSILAKRRQGQVQRVEHDMKMRQLSALKKQQNTKRAAGLAGVGNTLAAQGLSRAKPADGRHNLTDLLEGAGVKEDEIDDDEQDGEGGKVCHICVCVSHICVCVVCVWCVFRTSYGLTSTLVAAGV